MKQTFQAVAVRAPDRLVEKFGGLPVEEVRRIVNDPQDLDEALLAVEFDELMAKITAEILRMIERDRMNRSKRR